MTAQAQQPTPARPDVGDTATLWHRKPERRASRVWVEVLEISPDQKWARVRFPHGWVPKVKLVLYSRLTKADVREGR